jgi:hypothetical protein
MKIAIISLVDEAQNEIANLSLKNKFNYAQKHGYAFIFETRSLDLNRPTSWSKFLIIEKYIEKFEWIFWCDADSLILKPEIKLEEYIENCNNNINLIMPAIVPEDNIFLDRRWKIQVNTSHFFVKNNQQSLDILNKSYQNTQFIDQGWKFDFGGKHAEEEGALNYYLENNPCWQNIKLLKRGELYISEKGFNSSTFIVHFGGPEKIYRMKNFIFSNEKKIML